jgi:TolA-binding protein
MSEAGLREHARALRATRDGSFAGAAATRQRILVAAHRRKRGRRVLVVACASMATLLVLSTAWAELTGVLPRVMTLVRATESRAPHENGTARAPSRPVAGTATATATATATGTATGTATPTVLDPVSRPRSEAVVASRESGAARVRDASRLAVDTDAAVEESAYEAAHRAHFTERDPAKALRGWDAYLAAYPDGRFALEARYNRALALVRLGRSEDARAALGPFAEGRYGTYRRTEARELLNALPQAP